MTWSSSSLSAARESALPKISLALGESKSSESCAQNDTGIGISSLSKNYKTPFFIGLRFFYRIGKLLESFPVGCNHSERRQLARSTSAYESTYCCFDASSLRDFNFSSTASLSSASWLIARSAGERSTSEEPISHSMMSSSDSDLPCFNELCIYIGYISIV